MPDSPFMPAGDGVRVAVKVTPGARRPGVAGLVVDVGEGVRLAVRVSAPAEGGRANAALIDLLARRWGVAARRIDIVQGGSARRKQLLVAGDPEELMVLLQRIEAPQGDGNQGAGREKGSGDG